MYIDDSGGRYYTSDGEQHCRQAPFLILCQPEGYEHRNAPIRALVRKVAMHQCGHWMMGSARAFGHKITLSGSYGGDGLPTDVPMEVYERATPVPQELIDAWNKGEGWNSAGREAPAMAEWARRTFLEEK